MHTCKLFTMFLLGETKFILYVLLYIPLVRCSNMILVNPRNDNDLILVDYAEIDNWRGMNHAWTQDPRFISNHTPKYIQARMRDCYWASDGTDVKLEWPPRNVGKVTVRTLNWNDNHGQHGGVTESALWRDDGRRSQHWSASDTVFILIKRKI